MPVPGWGKGALHLLLRAFEFWLALALLCAAAGALNPSRQISQYAHTAWRIQDGDFSGTPHAITQTKDGYLWIGTETGLVRFDGVRFVPWVAPAGKHLPSRKISSLLGANDGSLWIGTFRGLAHWKDGSLSTIPTSQASSSRFCRIHKARSGSFGPECKIRKAGCAGSPIQAQCAATVRRMEFPSRTLRQSPAIHRVIYGSAARLASVNGILSPRKPRLIFPRNWNELKASKE